MKKDIKTRRRHFVARKVHQRTSMLWANKLSVKGKELLKQEIKVVRNNYINEETKDNERNRDRQEDELG